MKEPGDFSGLYPKGIVVEATPGTKWAYANNGYALIGEIIIRAEKASLQDVMERRIFGPLGMRDTDVRDLPSDALTTPYHRPTNDDYREQFARAGIPVPDEPLIDGHNIRGEFRAEFNKGMLAAGAAQSTIPDMARYASALLRRGAGIVKPETFDSMIASHHEVDPRLVSWGLSFARTPRFGRTLIGHGGAFLGGWNTNLAFVPDENIAIIQHMNIMLDSSAPVFSHVQRALFDPRVERSARTSDRPGDPCKRARDIRVHTGTADELPPGHAYWAHSHQRRRPMPSRCAAAGARGKPV